MQMKTKHTHTNTAHGDEVCTVKCYLHIHTHARTLRAYGIRIRLWERVFFSDHLDNQQNTPQTTKDNDLNMLCFLRSFNNIDRSGSPIPIEYLPAENTLSSKVRLMILYQNRPTTTIAVGDPLTLRIEAQDGYNQLTDIFATNVVARDPYSGRSIQLIDRYGYVSCFSSCAGFSCT